MPDVAGSSSDGGYGGSGGGFGGGDASFGGGLSGGVLGMDNAMSFSGPDAVSVGVMAGVGALGFGGVTGPAGAALAIGTTVAAGYASTPGTALSDLAQSMSTGLGVAVSANPGGFSMFEASMSAADFSGGASGGSDVAYAVNLGDGQIADFNGAGMLMGYTPDPWYWQSATGANGSEGGG